MLGLKPSTDPLIRSLASNENFRDENTVASTGPWARPMIKALTVPENLKT